MSKSKICEFFKMNSNLSTTCNYSSKSGHKDLDITSVISISLFRHLHLMIRKPTDNNAMHIETMMHNGNEQKINTYVQSISTIIILSTDSVNVGADSNILSNLHRIYKKLKY